MISAAASPLCSEPDCGRLRVAKGFCKRHYQQFWANGSPTIVRPNPRGTPEERFWRKVDKRGPDECWHWTGSADKDGYGQLRVGATQVRAHRFSYALANGEAPADLMVRHRCNNPKCVNPAHLRLGTHEENMTDRLDAGHYRRGQAHPVAKVSDADADAIRASTGAAKHVAARYGISASQVRNIRRGDQRAPL